MGNEKDNKDSVKDTLSTVLQNISMTDVQKYVLGNKPNGDPRSLYDIITDYKDESDRKKYKKNNKNQNDIYLSFKSDKKKKKKNKKKRRKYNNDYMDI